MNTKYLEYMIVNTNIIKFKRLRANSELKALKEKIAVLEVFSDVLFKIISPDGFYQLGIYEECPECERSEKDGHTPDCKLAAALAKRDGLK